MVVATFDTLKFANTLKAAGVPPQQAEAQAVAFAEIIQLNFQDLVSKDDLARAVEELRRDIADGRVAIDALKASTKADLARAVEELRREIAEAKKESTQLGKDLRAEMKELEQRLLAKIEALNLSLSSEIKLLRWMATAGLSMASLILVRVFFSNFFQ